jgi:hypothetical protein
VIDDGAAATHFALPEQADSLDIVVNEILFNPRPTGVDFVEIVNRSAKYVNLKGWKIVNGSESEKLISESDMLMDPLSYLVLTEDGNVLKGEYLQSKEETFLSIDMPAYSDDEGVVTIVDGIGRVIDSFPYSDQMHSVFIKDEEGVSLERISMDLPANEFQNWKSASSVAGYATPGYVNSNTRENFIMDEAILVEPEIFIPEHGEPDFTQIRYNFDQGGYVANVKIFDAQGREVKQLANNEILGVEGFFRWDGDHNNGTRARIGSYMVWMEVFDANGAVKTFRKRVAVAGRF